MHIHTHTLGTSGIINNLRSYLWIKIQQITSKTVCLSLYKHLFNLPMQWHVNKKTGEIIKIIDRSAISIDQILKFIFILLIQLVIQFLMFYLQFLTFLLLLFILL